MLHPSLSLLEMLVTDAGWDDKTFGLMSLVEMSHLLNYEPDLDDLAANIVQMASRLSAYRVVLAMRNTEIGEQVAERLRQHPSLTGWLEIRFRPMPSTARRQALPLVVMSGERGLHASHALPAQMRDQFNVGRHAILATSGGLRDLAETDDKKSSWLLYQLNRAIQSKTASSIILLGDAADLDMLDRAVWKVRQMIDSVPVDFGTFAIDDDGTVKVEKQF